MTLEEAIDKIVDAGLSRKPIHMQEHQHRIIIWANKDNVLEFHLWNVVEGAPRPWELLTKVSSITLLIQGQIKDMSMHEAIEITQALWPYREKVPSDRPIQTWEIIHYGHMKRAK